MFKGYYTLTSGMLCQNRNLNIIGNNLTNVSTPGFKKDTFLASTFQEEVFSRIGNKDKTNPTALGTAQSMITTPQMTVTDYSTGAYQETGVSLDFAIADKGFFQIQTLDGGTVYTRNGSFIIDDEGYLALPRVGRVMGENGPILLNTDDISVDQAGMIFKDGVALVDTLEIVNFDDYTQLQKTGEGVYQNNGQEAGTTVTGAVLWKSLERSNVNAIEEMTNMMTSQRAIQSASQILKMYDQLAAKATTEIGRV